MSEHENDRERVTAYVEPSLALQYRLIAAARHTSVGAVIREAMALYAAKFASSATAIEGPR
jgi:hypothetical protein